MFTALIVQYLNWILLTSPNLAPLRDTLKSQRNNPKLGYVWSCVVELRETFCPCWMYRTAWLSLSFSEIRVNTDCYFFKTINQGRQLSVFSLVLFNCFFFYFFILSNGKVNKALFLFNALHGDCQEQKLFSKHLNGKPFHESYATSKLSLG